MKKPYIVAYARFGTPPKVLGVFRIQSFWRGHGGCPNHYTTECMVAERDSSVWIIGNHGWCVYTNDIVSRHHSLAAAKKKFELVNMVNTL